MPYYPFRRLNVQECLDTYRRNVDKERKYKAELHLSLAEADAEHSKLVYVLAEQVSLPLSGKMKGTRKQKLAIIDPVLKDIRTVVMSLDFKNIIANINPSSANHLKCQETIHQLIRVKFPWLKKVPYQWMEIVDMLQRYKLTLHYHIVNWKLPEEGWIKCNTDGATKGNPGQSAYEFCMRNNNGDLVYAEGEDIGVATNLKERLSFGGDDGSETTSSDALTATKGQAKVARKLKLLINWILKNEELDQKFFEKSEKSREDGEVFWMSPKGLIPISTNIKVYDLIFKIWGYGSMYGYE
ncbi:hypothetical protein H5410_022335 [Solanum commersonii]|uniref:RNase H family protein n=1 Tax=Solanum commersonii TaxID=4109 RepID=A0A9J5ZJ54_SOLCO|nr:hypothetical protein H5410_022335 [Solanum commersonii]